MAHHISFQTLLCRNLIVDDVVYSKSIRLTPAMETLWFQIEGHIDSNSFINAQLLRMGISIIIPLYLGIKYKERCFASIKEQSLSLELFEVIIILNGPTDGSENIVSKFIV